MKIKSNMDPRFVTTLQLLYADYTTIQIKMNMKQSSAKH